MKRVETKVRERTYKYILSGLTAKSSHTTVLSRASAHGPSQLKHQNLRMGSHTEKCLNGSIIPVQATTQMRTKWTCIVGLSVLRQGQPDSGEGCIMLQSGLTRSLLAKFPHIQSSLAVDYTNFVLQGKNTMNKAMDTGVWTFDAWCCGAQSASEQSQLCELSGPTFRFTMQEFSMVGGYMENPEKRSKLGGGRLSGYGRLPRTIQ